MRLGARLAFFGWSAAQTCGVCQLACLLLQDEVMESQACRAQRRVLEFCYFVTKGFLAQLFFLVPTALNTLEYHPKLC